MNYLILSLKHSPWGNYCVWWGPNDCGFTSEIESAGIYSEERVYARPSYYDNGKDTRAIPLSAVKPLTKTVVNWPIKHEMGNAIRETQGKANP